MSGSPTGQRGIVSEEKLGSPIRKTASADRPHVHILLVCKSLVLLIEFIIFEMERESGDWLCSLRKSVLLFIC